jgi:hypothetical protein
MVTPPKERVKDEGCIPIALPAHTESAHALARRHPGCRDLSGLGSSRLDRDRLLEPMGWVELRRVPFVAALQRGERMNEPIDNVVSCEDGAGWIRMAPWEGKRISPPRANSVGRGVKSVSLSCDLVPISSMCIA